MPTLALPLLLKGHADHVTDIDWSPDGTRLATASRDWTGRVWDAQSGKSIVTIEMKDNPNGQDQMPDEEAHT